MTADELIKDALKALGADQHVDRRTRAGRELKRREVETVKALNRLLDEWRDLSASDLGPQGRIG